MAPPDAEEPAQPASAIPSGAGGSAPDRSGPFGLRGADPDEPIEWSYYQKSGATPDDKELLLAQRIDSLAEALREFPASPARREMLRDLYEMFAATLVQGVNVDLQHYIDDIDAKENEFYRRVVAPEQKKLLVAPTIWTFVTFLACLTLAYLFPTIDSVIAFAPLEWGDTIAMTVAGMLFGRLLYFAAAYGQQVTSLAAYNQIRALSGTIGMAVFFDIVIGAAASVAFLSEIIVIAIGAGGNGSGGGISTVTIGTSYLSAFVFGLIVGFAKTEFLRKFRGIATKALE